MAIMESFISREHIHILGDVREWKQTGLVLWLRELWVRGVCVCVCVCEEHGVTQA